MKPFIIVGIIVLVIISIFITFFMSEKFSSKSKWVDCPSKERTCSNGSIKSHWTCSSNSDCPSPGDGFEHKCIKGVCMRWKPETYDTTGRLSNTNINIAYREKDNAYGAYNKALPIIYKNITGNEYKGKMLDSKMNLAQQLDKNAMDMITDVLMISLKKNNRDDIIAIWIIFTSLINQLDQKSKRVLNITYNSIGEIDKITYTLNGTLCSPNILINAYDGLSKTVKIDDSSKKLIELSILDQKTIESLKSDYNPYMTSIVFSNLLIYQISKLGGFYV